MTPACELECTARLSAPNAITVTKNLQVRLSMGPFSLSSAMSPDCGNRRYFYRTGHDHRRQSMPVGAPLRDLRVSPHRSTERSALMLLERGAKFLFMKGGGNSLRVAVALFRFLALAGCSVWFPS